MNRKNGTLIGLALLMSLVSCGGDAQPEAPAAPQVTASTGTSVAAKAPAGPETLVAALYEQHARDQSPFFQMKSRELVDTYFEKTLADLIWKDAVASNGEVGALEFDPLYDAQDAYREGRTLSSTLR